MGGEMETMVLEQQLKKVKKKKNSLERVECLGPKSKEGLKGRNGQRSQRKWESQGTGSLHVVYEEVERDLLKIFWLKVAKTN